MTMPDLTLRPMGPTTVLVETDGRDPVAVAEAIRTMLGARVTDLIPAAQTVVVRCAGEIAHDPLFSDDLAKVVASVPSGPPSASGRLVEIPVVYDGEDLGYVADATGLTVQELVDAHTAVGHRAAFCGFAAGFAYLEVGDQRLTIARRATPRQRVPIGSVALAAGYTAVYPVASPGGWHLIGRTEARMWDPHRERPSLIEPGDVVRFVAR